MKHLLVVVLFVVGSSAAAAAQPSADTEKARALFAKGDAHFSLGEYPQAIAAFRESYRLARAPLLLYNIAQAYRLSGDCTNALAFYQSYLREDPKGPLAAKATERVPEMTTCAENEAAAAKAKSDLGTITEAENQREPKSGTGAAGGKSTATSDQTTATGDGGSVLEQAAVVGTDVGGVQRPSAGSAGRGLRIGGIAAVGIGVLAGVGAVYFVSDARSAGDELTSTCAVSCEWSNALSELVDRGNRADRNALWLTAGGAAAVVVGATLYYLGAKKRRAANREVTIVPLDGGAVASVAFTWGTP